jgi:ATP-binding cassette subfamily F protein 3
VEAVNVNNVSKDYAHRSVLTGVSFRINVSQKLGLIGANGTGKTSILRLITGDEPLTGGVITKSRGLRIGYVAQQVEYEDTQTVLSCALAEHTKARRALREQEEHLARAPVGALPEAEDAYETAREAYERVGGDQLPQRATSMLDSLGLAGRGDQLVGALSGGEKNILSLTQALLADPDLLLLDEPDNHLDFAGLAWLERFLASFKGALLIVSHNRYLLDRVVDGILHLEDGRIHSYVGNYSEYRATMLREKLSQRADYVANQRRLAQLEALVKRFEELARRTGDAAWGKRLRARRSQLAREQRQAVEKPAPEASGLWVNITAEASRADIALQIRAYSRSFGELRLFEDADADVSCGESVALVGPNGSGKTTFLRDVIDHGAWDHPTIRVGPSLRVGYCAQEQEVLDDKRSVLDELLADGLVTRQGAFTVLPRFLFHQDDWDKRVADLSGGERNRLQLAKVLLRKPNFLILDEPTNHLDIPAREAVEEVLADFEGTILLVSHDRYLLDKVADRVIEVRDKRLVSYPGSFSEFWHASQAAGLETARVSTRRRARERRRPRRSVTRKAAPAAPPSELQTRIAEAEREKLALESRIAEAFTRGDHREGSRVAKQLERHAARLEDLYERWAEEEG